MRVNQQNHYKIMTRKSVKQFFGNLRNRSSEIKNLMASMDIEQENLSIESELMESDIDIITANDYETLFMYKNTLKERKTLYVAKELQDKLAEIVMSMRNRDMTIGVYVENIIQHHFEMYKDEINALSEAKFKKLL